MRKGNFYPKGVMAIGKAFQFVFQAEKAAKEITVRIYAKEKEIMSVPVSEECRHGRLYSVVLEDIPSQADSYCYYADGKQIPDLYARGVLGMQA